MKRAIALFLAISFCAVVAVAQTSRPDIVGTVRIDGMDLVGRFSRDSNGIIQILAFNRHDLYFLNGYAHAHDRLFQMDVSRRVAAGTLAELVGAAVISQDVQVRTIGLRRAAEASLPIYSARARGVLEAYAAGVNAYLRDHPALPPEFAALEVNQIAPWTPVDSVSIGKLIAFNLSFDLNDINATVALRTYQAVGQAAGFNGAALFFEDLFRSAPFDKASTVPNSSSGDWDYKPELPLEPDLSYLEAMEKAAAEVHPSAIEQGRNYMAHLRSIGFFDTFNKEEMQAGSNEWGFAGRHTSTGRSMIANDPHLSLSTPSTFYPIVLKAGRISVAGHGFPGTPGVILGHNDRIAWGATVVGYDVTDVYQEQVVPVAAAPAGLGVMVNGQAEWLFPIVQVFRRNVTGDSTMNNLAVVSGGTIPPATLIVVRRNAPIVSLDTATGVGLSVQYTGLNPTRELETFLTWAEAEDLDDFKAGLQFFDFGAQNWAYTDVDGNIAYFTSGEIPIREDLQAGQVVGLPPSFIRSGAGGNEWIRVLSPTAPQATPAQVLPFEEMPQIVNPASGWFVNANNDPAGTTLDNNPLNETRPGGGILYLGRWYANGMRAGRITQMVGEQLSNGGKVTPDEMKAMQADVVLRDAQFFVPFITRALQNAMAAGAPAPLGAFAANPAVVSAVNRLSNWDFSTPTGIPEGFDSADVNGSLSAPSAEEIQKSVAATIYSLWRARFIANTIEPVIAQFNASVPGGFPGPNDGLVLAALRNLLENYDTRFGAGVSGINFFNLPEVPNNAQTAAFRRDVLILKSVADALQLLASDTFKPAFNNSTNQDDYRWGKLHRIVFSHPLGDPFNIPPAGGAFPHPLGAELRGIPTDGGYEVVDASTHSPRAQTLNGFMFGSGPARRFIAEGRTDGINAETSTPGGPSGVVGTALYFSLLRPWLTNEYYPSVLMRGPNLPFIRD